MSATVHVKGISHQTTEKEVRDFFSFCGKIQSLSVTPVSSEADSSKSATVTFEKETAAKTALLLDNTQLGPAHVSVTSAASIDELAKSGKSAGETHEPAEGDDVPQEDKPRARIFAEYLAHGYVISDKVIERGIALDKQHGISDRFNKALREFDTRFHATERTKAVDERLGVSKQGAAAWRGLNSYFDKALSSPTGKKLRQFYVEGNKQVMDVHNEARHLANLKGGKTATATGEGAVVPGSAAEQAGLEAIPGTEKTKCLCAGKSEGCACEAGKCACAGCAKNDTADSAAIAAAAATTEKAPAPAAPVV